MTEHNQNPDSSSEEGKFTFRGATVTETMKKVTRKLGSDALILSKRELKPVKRKGVLGGFLGGDDELVEIVAASGKAASPVPPTNSKPSLLQRTYSSAPPAAGKNQQPFEFHSRPGRMESSSSGIAARLDSLEQSVQDNLRNEIGAFMAMQARGGLPAVGPELIAAYRSLIESDINVDIARNVVEAVHQKCAGAVVCNPDALRQELVKEIAGRIRVRDALCVGGKSPTVVALVGPTGVGKTSTIAKIAVDMVYKRNLNVGIINEDARRPGAEAQLLNLSQLLGIKVCAAETSERVESEMSRMRDMDLVLIDTTGRGPRDKEGISELSGYLEAVNPDETHLLISADISERSGLEVTRSFRKIDYTHLAISKMDEAASFGVIVSLAAATGQGLGFLTRGREYMESVIPANPAALAGLMLGSPSSGNRGEC